MDFRVNPGGDNTNNRGGSDGIRRNPDRAPKRKVDHTRTIQHQIDMRREQKEGMSRADRADRINIQLNQLIAAINHVFENIGDKQIEEYCKSSMQLINKKYSDMFTVVIEKYPKLFEKKVPEESAGPSQHIGEEQQSPLSQKAAGKLPERAERAESSQRSGEEEPLLPKKDDEKKDGDPKLIERIKKKDMLELVGATWWQKERDEMTARLAVGEVRDLFQRLERQLHKKVYDEQRAEIAILTDQSALAQARRDLRAQLEAEQTQNSEFQERINTERAAASQFEGETRLLQTEKEGLASRLANAEEENSRLRAENAKLTNESALAQERDALRAQLEAEQTQNSEFQERIIELRDGITKLQRKLNTEKAGAYQLKDEIKTAEQQRDTERARADRLEKELEEVRTSNAALREEVRNQQGTNEDLR